MKYISSKQEAPTVEHLAVLEFGSIYIEGDERSRTCPGHGYPAHSESTVKYIAFESEKELQGWLDKQSDQELQKIQVIRVKPAQVQTKRVLNLS